MRHLFKWRSLKSQCADLLYNIRIKICCTFKRIIDPKGYGPSGLLKRFGGFNSSRHRIISSSKTLTITIGASNSMVTHESIPRLKPVVRCADIALLSWGKPKRSIIRSFKERSWIEKRGIEGRLYMKAKLMFS